MRQRSHRQKCGVHFQDQTLLKQDRARCVSQRSSSSSRRDALPLPAKRLLSSHRIFLRMFKMYYSHLVRNFISN
jgi:hypothetical protein